MDYVLPLVVGLLFAWLCHSMAAKRGRNEVLWAVLGFFFGFIPAIILLIIGDANKNATPPPPPGM